MGKIMEKINFSQYLKKNKDKFFRRVDTWFNQNTGMGGSRDKNLYSYFSNRNNIASQELEELYRFYWLPKRIVDKVVEDAMREQIDINIDENFVDPLNKALKRLDYRQKFTESLKQSRLYGGCCLIYGAVETDDLREPFVPEKLEMIEALNPLDRYKFNISKEHINADPFSKDYNYPEFYPLTGDVDLSDQDNANQKAILHKSRLLRFDGEYLPFNVREGNDYWHDSIINAIMDQIKHVGIGFETTSQLMHDFVVKVLKIENLWSLMAAGNESALETRIQDMAVKSSVYGMYCLDNNEELQKIQTPITGLPEILEKFMDIVAAASNIPKTILFGQQLGKLAGAEVTLTNYYDHISSYQEAHIAPAFKKLVDDILRTKEIAAPQNVLDEWTFSFRPLWQESDQERATTRKLVAETDSIYMMNGVLMPEEVADSRWGGDEYSIETVIDDKIRREMMEREPIEKEIKELEEKE